MSEARRYSQVHPGDKDADYLVQANILDNLLDGVVSVGLDGIIRTFNPAAARILGVDREVMVGHTLTETLLMTEGFEAFCEAILDAVRIRTRTERRMVELAFGDESSTLTVATSYVRSPDTGEPVGVIAVFSDITQMQALQEAERRMARELEKQNDELKRSYRQVEESHERLQSVIKKVQVARVLATVAVIGLFLGAGVWSWGGLDPFVATDEPEVPAGIPPEATGTQKSIVVQPEPLALTTSIIGQLAPWQQVVVSSPTDGRIGEVLAAYGEQVAEGQELLRLDMEETRLEHLEAQVEHEKAKKEIEELESWQKGPEVAAARRAFSKARMSMEGETANMKRSEFLLAEGLIPSSQHDDAKRRFESQRLDLEAARQDLDAVRAKGGKDALQVASLNLGKTRNRLDALTESLSRDRILAPIAGVVQEADGSGRTLNLGKEVKKGDPLMVIMDVAQLAVVSRVDEVEVTSIQPGQAVTVRGDAFPGLELSGEVAHVSSQPVGRSGVGVAPKFEVKARLDGLDYRQRDRLRVGMSAQLRIVTYHNPAALMVPINAVDLGQGMPRVRILDNATGEVTERTVEIGLTTLSAVEVRDGIRAGDRVLLPGG